MPVVKKSFQRNIFFCFTFITTVLIISIMTILLPTAKAEVFNSLASIEKLIKTQEHVIESIKSALRHVNGLTDKIMIQRYLKHCEKEHRIAIKNISEYIGNPINAYRLIKRLSLDLINIEDILKGYMYSRNNVLTYPTLEDLDGAIKGVLHLTIIYNLNITELANGTLISNISTNRQTFSEFVTPMTSTDCYELGQAAHEFREYKVSIAWLTEALRKYPQCPECHFNDVELVNFISRSYYILDDIENSLLWKKKSLSLNVTNLQIDEHKKLIEHFRKRLDTENCKINKKKIIPTANKKKAHTTENDTFDILCTGETSKTVNNKSLHCYYKKGSQSFIRLMSFRVEELHLDPDVMMYHDVISDKEIDEFKFLAKPMLETGTVNDLAKSANYRVVQVAWFYEETNTANRLSRRISQFTDYKVNTSQKLEIASHGIGGFHIPHYDRKDMLPSMCSRNGADIMFDLAEWRQMTGKSTVLLYLSDVDQGGATVFVKLGLTIFPKKNAAVSWENLNLFGQRDLRMLHAGCPVLRGHKWS